MPTFMKGEMFKAPGFIIVTANSFLTSEMKLVMGRGAAWQLKLKVPGIDKAFGEMIHRKCGHLGFYGLIFHKKYGAAQVRYRFNDKPALGLISLTMTMLGFAANKDKNTVFNINFPGIGNGGLRRHQVESLLKYLPDNVHVWEKEGGIANGLHPAAQSKIVQYTKENSLGLGSPYDRSYRYGLRSCAAGCG